MAWKLKDSVIAYNKINNYKSVNGRGSIYSVGHVDGLLIHDNEIYGAFTGHAIYIECGGACAT